VSTFSGNTESQMEKGRHCISRRFNGNGNSIHHLRTCLLVRKRIVSTAETVEFITDGMSCVML
jgi:hypothetical protein